MTRKKTAIVTGCAGFIGSHLTEHLLSTGWHVIGIDDYSTGRKSNIDIISRHPRKSFFTFLNQRITNENVKAVISKVDYVFHLAAHGSIPRSIENPESNFENNVLNSLHILNAIKDSKHKPRLIYASSSSVYGDISTNRKKESAIGHALSPYALNKQTVEKYCELYAKVYGVESIALRFFNVFGPRQRVDSEYSAVIPKWSYLMVNKEKVELYGDPTKVRDFTPVAIVIKCIDAAFKMQLFDNKYIAINVGCGHMITLKVLFDMLAELTGYKKEPVISDKRKSDVHTSYACIARMRRMLYNPKDIYIPQFKTYLNEVIQWIQYEQKTKTHS